MHYICTNLAAGVVSVVGADAGVGWPEAAVAVAVTAYVVPGARPVRTQSYGTAHVTVMGVPPPIGVAVRVYGPVTPEEVGDTSTLMEPEPLTTALRAGAPAAGVVIVPAGDGGVGLPDDESMPVTANV